MIEKQSNKKDKIEIKNAHIHNLKHVDVSIPKGKLTVITGVSGSGKSSLAFDTLYEEGKRRYLLFSDTQFEIDSEPGFDSITGLSPTVAVEQRIIRQSNPRSTVGTRTKISSALSILFSNYGEKDLKYDDGLPLSMSMFQRNSAAGMCSSCLGKGHKRIVFEDEIYGNKEQRIGDLIEGGMSRIHIWHNRLKDYLKTFGLSEDVKLKELTDEQFIALKYGSPKTEFAGVNFFAPTIEATWERAKEKRKKLSERQKLFLFSKPYAEERICKKCSGSGLGIQARHTTIEGKIITDLEDMYISDLMKFIKDYADKNKNPVAMEIYYKLACMVEVGLYHLSLSRPIPTLSGGEIQRLFLASYIIAEMDSIIFVFDEPTIGLHEAEKEKLISIIKSLIQRGNTVIAVEHDENFMKNADYIIDMGPEAGIRGGEKIFEGGYKEFLKCKYSKTAPFLADRTYFEVPNQVRDTKQKLIIKEVTTHNLKNVTVSIPLKIMVGIAGVSGSGKSSLISDTLVPKLKELLKNRCITEIESKDFIQAELLGISNIKKCIVIDQKPIGRSKTSCPATYTGIYDRIRELFAATETAKQYGYSIGMFSVNSQGGCRICHGEGVISWHIGMGNHIETVCEACHGTGFLPEVMEVKLDGKNIREILNMTVEEAVEFFKDKDNVICTILTIMQKVGMGYITLGQKTPTISGGESQRIKLAKELSKGKNTGNILYILDEPTTGLSFYDSKKLMKLLQELVDAGNSVIITEHDPYVLSNCDYLIELGPGGGSDGGEVIAYGTPLELKNNENSIIGGYLF